MTEASEGAAMIIRGEGEKLNERITAIAWAIFCSGRRAGGDPGRGRGPRVC